MTAMTYADARVLAVRFSGRGAFHLFARFDGEQVVAECKRSEHGRRAHIREGAADCRDCLAARDKATREAIRAANDAKPRSARVLGSRGVVVALAKAGDVVRSVGAEMACTTGAEEDGVA